MHLFHVGSDKDPMFQVSYALPRIFYNLTGDYILLSFSSFGNQMSKTVAWNT